jgi:hypothetical protein
MSGAAPWPQLQRNEGAGMDFIQHGFNEYTSSMQNEGSKCPCLRENETGKQL